jgi:hypothetical protein
MIILITAQVIVLILPLVFFILVQRAGFNVSIVKKLLSILMCLLGSYSFILSSGIIGLHSSLYVIIIWTIFFVTHYFFNAKLPRLLVCGFAALFLLFPVFSVADLRDAISEIRVRPFDFFRIVMDFGALHNTSSILSRVAISVVPVSVIHIIISHIQMQTRIQYHRTTSVSK